MRVLALAAALALPAPCLAAGTPTVLHNFTNTPDGAFPGLNLVMDRSGSLFGSAQNGGANGDGCVFELTPPASGQAGWTETILHSFGKATGPQGANPYLITLGAPGHLFVVTSHKVGPQSHSIILELSRHGSLWTPLLVRSLGGPNDGDGISNTSPLLIDNTGAIFGETSYGGTTVRSGSVFKLTPPAAGSTAWTEQLIWNFSGSPDFDPHGQLVFDPAGNLYGTSEMGGPNFAGAAWELSPPAAGSSSWTRTVLYNFAGSALYPGGSLLRDAAGNLYGESSLTNMIWELSPPASGGTTWTETPVYYFNLHSQFDTIYGFAFDNYGNLIGTTSKFLFELKPPSTGQTAWTNHVLWSFDPQPVLPGTPLIARGNRIFGTIAATNHSNLGLVFEYKH